MSDELELRAALDQSERLRCLEKTEAGIEIARLKSLIDRDRTGLANALNAVRQVLRGYGWIPAGEWGSYELDQRTETNLRAEIYRCFDEAERIAVDALRASGSLANEAFRPKEPPKPEFTPIAPPELPELQGRRCPRCQSLMIHTRLGGYRCNRGCQ